MKAISFEGFRRFVRGNRDKESESSSQTFKRSNSFKRATFRKSLHKHEKVTLPNGLVVKTSALQRKESLSSSSEEKRDDGYSTDGGEASGTNTADKISYDQWVANSHEEDFGKCRAMVDESCPSTLSTNKLSSLDSGVRHSMDSKKNFSLLDFNKRLSLDQRRVMAVDSPLARPDLSKCASVEASPSSHSIDKNFCRSVCTDTPVPPTRLKSLLGSPRVAPKYRDHSPAASGFGVSAYSVHSTPNRNRNVCQPMSAPSTPGKQIQRVLQRPSHNTPTHQPMRSSLHEKERFCAVHGSPALHRVQLQERSSSVLSGNDAAGPSSVTSPKPLNKWSAMLSNYLSSKSPARKSQTLKANSGPMKRSSEDLSSQSIFPSASATNHRCMRKDFQHSQQQIYQGNADSPVVRRRPVHSTNNSPALLRSRLVNPPSGSMQSVPLTMDARLGIARAIGGPRPPEEKHYALNSHQSPRLLQRNLSQPPMSENRSSPATVHRQSSVPTPEVSSPVFRPRPVSSPPIQPALPPRNSSMLLSTDLPVINSSQFYPGKIAQSSLVSGLPSVSIVGGRSLSSDRCYSRADSDMRSTPSSRPLSAERPKTPSHLSRLSVPSWGRPFSLALNCAKGKADLLSPASFTSESSNKSDRRRRRPSVLVGKASWFSRNSSVRRSIRLRNCPKPIEIYEFTEESEDPDADVPPPPPPRPARLIPPEQYKKLQEASKSKNPTEHVFIPPQKRKPPSPVKFPMSLWKKMPQNNTEVRQTHADILMPMSRPFSEYNSTNNHSTRHDKLVEELLRNSEREDDMRDTSSEPGGAKYALVPRHKPKSVPNTARINLKIAKNPETFLRALGLEKKKNKKKISSTAAKGADVSEKIITQLLLEQLTSKPVGREVSDSIRMDGCSSGGDMALFNREQEGCLESPSESLSSLVSSVMSSRASNGSRRSNRKGKKSRRKKSHRRVPSVPAYPSWKKCSKGAGAAVAAARDQNGEFL